VRREPVSRPKVAAEIQSSCQPIPWSQRTEWTVWTGISRGQRSDLDVPSIYEFVAVRSERLPTITDLVKSLPLVARGAVIAVVVLALVDHFGPGFVL
jgi:hypothetical protein